MWACQAFLGMGGESCGGPGPPGAGVLLRCRPAQPGLQLSSPGGRATEGHPCPGAAPAHTGETPWDAPQKLPSSYPAQGEEGTGLALASVIPAKTLTSEQTYLLGATNQSATVCPVAPKTSRLSRVGRCHGNLLTNPWQPCVHSGLCRRDCELAHPRRGSGQPCIRGARGAPAAAPLSTRVLCHLAPGRPVPGLALEPLQMGELGSPREDHMEQRPRQCLTEKQRKWGTL